MILRVGLTGGIASGKSTVARLFRDLGCVVVDADAIVAELYRPGAAGHKALVAAYGQPILLPDGTIDRVKLAGIAFSSPESAQRLNALIHPLVIAEEAEMLRRLGSETSHRIVVVEATLLLESGGRERYDRIVVVDVSPEVQIARAIGRGMTRDEAERRIAHQMTRSERLRAADYVIDNSGDVASTAARTREVYEDLRRQMK